MKRLFSYFQLEEEESPTNKSRLKKTAFQVFDMKRAFVTLDQAFDYVGDNSTYQKRITSILSFQWIFYAFFVMGMPMLFATPQFVCEKTLDSGAVEFHPCTEQQICNENIIHQVVGYQSITKDFQLYCGQKYMVGLIASLFFVGQSFGGMIFPILANSFGRKRVIIFGVIVGGLSIILCGFMTSISLIMLLFFITGFALSGQETVVYVYITEISGNISIMINQAYRFRSIATNTLVIIWAASMIFYPTYVNLLISWRILLVAGIGIPLLVGALISMVFYVESPRWLASKQKFEECRRVLRLVSIYNKRMPFDFNFIEEMEQYNNQALQLKPSNEHTSKLLNSGYAPVKKRKIGMSYFELCRHRKLSKITAILMLSWFLRYFTYYGIQFSIQTFGFSVSYGLIFSSVAEVLGALVNAYFKLRWNRIKSFQISLVAITVCCLFFFFMRIPKDCLGIEDSQCHYERYFNLAMAFILKFATTFYMTTLTTYTGEVYPTKVRTNGYGICMTFGSIGSSLVPLYVSYAMQVNLSINPLTNVSAISTLVLVLTLFLPETFRQSMYDDIQEDFLDNDLITDVKIDRELEMQHIKKENEEDLWIIDNNKSF